MSLDTRTADELLGAALRHQQPRWPERLQTGELLDRARAHGVVTSLRTAIGPGWPSAVVDEIQSESRAQAMWEMRHQQLLGQVLTPLRVAGAAPVVIKGTALAYTLYPEPWMRFRADTDLVVADCAAESATKALRELGFQPVEAAPSYQTTFLRNAADGSVHALDIHWRFNNSPLLADLLNHEELLANSIPIPALGEAACAPNRVYSMLIACLHKETHRHNPYYVNGIAQGPERLIWLLDIDLLAGSFTEGDWEDFCELAVRKGLARTCSTGLEDAIRSLGTRVPEGHRAILSKVGGELPARYLESGPLMQQWMDLQSLRGWRPRFLWLKDAVLPPAPYMRARYGDNGPLAAMYAKRAVRGILRRLN